MTTAANSPKTPASKPRVPLWDNARFLCVALVVIGHAIQRLIGQSDHALMVYIFIYAFHVPAFAIISGYFSKASPPSARQMKRVVTDILIPYAIMQTIWSGVQFLTEGSTSINPTTPHWTLWFLLALAFFRVALPYLALLKFPMLWAIVFSVGVGYLGNIDNTFSLARCIGLLPFFVLGWQLRQWNLIVRWRVLDRGSWWIRVTAWAVLAGWAVTVMLSIDFWKSVSVHWFFYDDSYDGLGQDQWWAGFGRIGLMVLAALLSAAFLVVVPRRETWITGFGQATMYIYLLHSFVLYPLRQTGVLKGENPSDWLLVAVILAAIAISILLATPLVRKTFRPFIEPKPGWLFSETDEKPAGPSRKDPTGSRRS